MRTNYVTNPSIETAITGWYEVDTNLPAGDPTIERVAGGYIGSYETKWSYTAGTGDTTGTADQYCLYSGAGTAAQDEVWTVSAYIKLGSGTTSGVTVSLRIPYYDASNTYIGVVSGEDISGSLTTDYQRFYYTGTLPSTATISQVGAYLHVGSVADGDAWDLRSDCWLLEKTGTLGDYFDGSTTDTETWTYAWTGTEHASTSTATEVEAGFVGMTVTKLLQG